MFQCESQRAEKGRFAILFEQGEIVGEPVGLNTIGSKIAFVKIGTVGARDHLAGGMCRGFPARWWCSTSAALPCHGFLGVQLQGQVVDEWPPGHRRAAVGSTLPRIRAARPTLLSAASAQGWSL